MPAKCLLDAGDFQHYAVYFSSLYPENVVNAIPDQEAWQWLAEQVPLFDCSDPILEEIYYFRWWIYRKHIKQTPDGYVVTEFLPEVRHGGKHNTINCPLGHQFYEGRWIKDSRFLDEYGLFMLDGGGNPNAYTCWFADGLYQRFCITRNANYLTSVLEGLLRYYAKWEERERDGLFRYTPWMEGMEFSISGNQDERFRPAFNSYMYGDAVAISKIASLAGRESLANQFHEKAIRIKRRIQDKLWNSDIEFFATLDLDGEFMPLGDPVREAVGYIPWYFNLPDKGYEIAWKQLNDYEGFSTPVGITSAEIRHPQFLKMNPERTPTWDGPIWPFSTAQTLTAMQNLLRNYEQAFVTPTDYIRELCKYAASHRRDGKPSISEVVRDPYVPQMCGSEHYNHSTFCDLIITGLAGIVPRPDDVLEVQPLIPQDWGYFCLDGVHYHGRKVSVVWDPTGRRYEQGMSLYVDGKIRNHSARPERMLVALG